MDYEDLINPNDLEEARREYHRIYVSNGDERLCSFEWFYKMIWRSN